MTAALAFAVVLGLSQSARAATLIAIDDPSTVGVDLILNDDDFDRFVQTGTLTSADGFLSAAGQGDPAAMRMDLGALMGSFGDAQSLGLYFTQTDFSGVGTAFSSIIGGTTGGVAYAAFYDPSNAPFGLANLIGTVGTFGAGEFSFTTSEGGVGGASFSMTQVVGVTHPGDVQLDFTHFLASVQVVPTAVPEPATMALFGLGLAASGIARRRARRNRD